MGLVGAMVASQAIRAMLFRVSRLLFFSFTRGICLVRVLLSHAFAHRGFRPVIFRASLYGHVHSGRRARADEATSTDLAGHSSACDLQKVATCIAIKYPTKPRARGNGGGFPHPKS